jgi:DUF1365 family protein
VQLVSGASLYEGTVMHTRPPGMRGRYLFRYRVYLWLIDIEAPPRLPRLLAPLGKVRSRDHLGDPARSIRENIDGFLAEHGIDLEGGRVLLLSNPRSFGYVFNPLSVYWCNHRDGGLRCIVAEVHNTHAQRHCYLLEPGDRGRVETDKAFYVSPFLTVDGRYRMSFSPPDERLSIQMELIQDERRVFQASLTARRRALSTPQLLRTAVRYPLMAARVTVLIHYNGVKLWLRGVPRVPRPDRTPREDVG